MNLARKTVARKLIFLSAQAQIKINFQWKDRPLCSEVEFDDVETFEHTKCKPLAITVAVEAYTRRVIGFEVSEMCVKSSLKEIAFKKYGPRKDQRYLARRKLFGRLKSRVHPNAIIKSDKNPHYFKDVKLFFSQCSYKTFKGRRGCIVGQGELKRIGFDPMFSLNHTAAKMRAGICRLIRKTWCTTKKKERLTDHLYIYFAYHNENLK